MQGLLTSVFTLWFLTVYAAPGNAPYFYSVTAKAGDGITILLNRYELDEYECNMDKFLELNQLKRKDPLFEGKEYKWSKHPKHDRYQRYGCRQADRQL